MILDKPFILKLGSLLSLTVQCDVDMAISASIVFISNLRHISVALVRQVSALENSLLEAYSSAFNCSNLRDTWRHSISLIPG